MNRLRFVLRTLVHFWRVNLAVMLGVVAATAVLTGALLVGDSMRGSLQKISLDGLGKIDEILLMDRFFREDLAKELAAKETFQAEFERASSIIIFPNATAIRKLDEKEKNVANKVTLIGCRSDFWDFGAGVFASENFAGRAESFDDSSNTLTPVILNEALAADLGITQSDIGQGNSQLILQIPKPQLINADNPVGKKADQYETIALLEIVEIVPTESLGRFTLHPTQVLPRILFLPIGKVQEALQQENFANAMVVSAKSTTRGTSESQSATLNSLLKPSLDDLGLILKPVDLTYDDKDEQKSIGSYISLSSDQLLLTDPVIEVANKAYQDLNSLPIFTYLANGIEIKSGGVQAPFPTQPEAIPFSMVASVDWTETFQPRSAISGNPIEKLENNQVVLNAWSVDDLLDTAGVLSRPDETGDQSAERIAAYKNLIGSKIAISFYEPEASHGKLIERVAEFELVDVAAMTQPKSPFRGRRPAVFDRPPTLANDPDLTPFVPGLTDKRSLRNSDLPFETDVRHPQDNDYWDEYRTTPKAFVSLAAGQELWQSRFGKVTSLRIDSDVDPAQLARRFIDSAEEVGEDFGFHFTPIKRRNFVASSGSTPFDVLFLALSFFIIASALILIALLFRLGVEQKSQQLGLLSAVGLNQKQRGQILLLEGSVLAGLGAMIGVAIGVLYAQLMVYGLTTWWVDAVMTSFMEFHWSMRSLLIGLAVGVLVSLLTIWVTVRRMEELSVRELLSNRSDPKPIRSGPVKQWIFVSMVVCFLVAVGLSVLAATSLGGEAQAGAFMGSGFLMLAVSLAGVWRTLRSPEKEGQLLGGRRMAIQNAGRNPLRSTLTIGLVASATFLIVAVSSFHLAPTREGTGGFEFLAESSRPIVGDFQDSETAQELFGESYEELKNLEVYSLRYLPGDEAGCNNPFQAVRPKVLGVTDDFINRFDETEGFAWGGSIAKTDEERKNPWQLLKGKTDDGSIPVIIDKNTAMYSLKIFGVGGNYAVEFDGETVNFKVVGFLSNSTLQGSLIIDESNFSKTFRNVSGYRSFLISGKSEPPTASQIGKLESELSNYGFDASSSVEILKGFLAVQNTYLSTFQTLGAFGLLLGTFGLATVQLRNVVERKKELALMRAIGFSKNKVGKIVLAEHAVLLFGGMFIGALCALFAVIPHILVGGAQVPLGMLATVLISILVVGFLSGLGAFRSSIQIPILSALRSE